MTRVAVLGATGAVGGRFVEIVAGERRAPVRAIVHHWWHTARVDRYPVELRSVGAGATPTATDVAAALDGCTAAVSCVDGPEADPSLATALVEGAAASGIGRLVHLGCLGSFGAVREGRLDETVDPPRPPGVVAARRWSFEQGLLDAGRDAGVEVVVVTAPLIYGPFMREGARVPRDQVERGRVAVAAGSGPCHLVYVDDVVEALWAAVQAPGRVHGRIFATGPVPITWQQFFEAFEAVVGRPGVAVVPEKELAALARLGPDAQDGLRWPPVPGTGRRLIDAVGRRTVRRGTGAPSRRRLVLPDPEELAARAATVEVPLDRAQQLLGWAPVVPFAEGMRRTSAYLRWADPR